MLQNRERSGLQVHGSKIVAKKKTFCMLALVIQRDYNMLRKWADKWRMAFNLDKYEVVHFRKSKPSGTFTVNCRTLGSIARQMDIKCKCMVYKSNQGNSGIKIIK